MRVVINKCYGGFGLSPLAQVAYAKRKGKDLTFYHQIKYEFRDGYDEYERVELPESGPIAHALTKDFGPRILKLQDGYYWYPTIERGDPDLLAVIDEMGCEAASDSMAKLRVVEIPDGVEWEIDEYDGMERVREAARSWG